MEPAEVVLFDGNTKFDHYQVIDMIYIGRKSRVLFSGQRSAAQSGIPRDGKRTMLFDYNQRFLELVGALMPKNILLIGGGAFTLPVEILKFFPNITVDVVERDPELANLAKEFFGLKPNKNLNIVFGDGRKYLEKTTKIYDLILLDAFEHSVIPHALSTNGFVALLQARLSKKGVAAVNVISAYHGPNNGVMKNQYATYKSVFKHADIYPADNSLSLWISQNFLLVATDKLIKPKYNLRFGSIKPPIISPENIFHDK